MTKRILFFAVLAAMIVTLMVPLGASANILDASVNWYGQSYEGQDLFYNNRNVVAFLEGSTARVEFGYMNDTGEDITAKPFIQFDWGARFYGAAKTVAAGEATTMGIEFATPSSATAGLVEHGYFISVEYRENSGVDYSVATQIGYEWNAGVGGTVHTLPNHPIVPATIQVWRSIDTGVSWEAFSGFTLNEWSGLFTLNTATAVPTRFKFNYDYYENLGQGNAVDRVFSVAHHPPGDGQVVDGTLAVYLTDDYATTITQQTTGWTFDAMSGEITFDTPPTYNNHVLARYEWWDAIVDRYNSSDPPNRTFVVYSQAQADAQQASIDYSDAEDEFWEMTQLVDYYVLSVGARQALTQAYIEDDAARDLYVAGDFAGAQAGWDAAIAKVNEAMTAEAALYGTVEDGLTGLVTGASGVVDAYGNKLQAEADHLTGLTEAEARKMNAEAGMTNTIGVFMILIGVAVILASVGGILWAYSRLVAAKGPKQPQM